MSTVRTLALGALMLVGVAGVSAAQSTATPRTRADAGSYRRGPGGHGEFGDLKLTDAQKAQVKAIRANYQPQRTALRAQTKPLIDAAKAARQKGDTATARADMGKARQLGESIRTQENADIRAILTPDQQTKFEAHEKAMADRGAKGGKRGWGHKRAGTAPASK